MIDLRRSGKFPQKFEDGGVTWEVLRREGLWLLLKGTPSAGGFGKVRFAVASICQDKDSGALFCRPSMTVNDLEQGSPFLDRAKMEAVFEKKAAEEKNRGAQASRKAAEEARKNELIMQFRDKVAAARDEQATLIAELKKSCLTPDVRFNTAKRTREICSRLAEIEQLLHHFKPVEVGAI